jgi:hypothetical protein
MGIIYVSLVVFAVTLIWTKSKIFGGKREFVQKRYDAAKVGGQKPGLLHEIWNALWTCPMCCGFWIALIVCWFYPVFDYFSDVLIVFGLNWLWHCLEDSLFYTGEKMKEKPE